MMFSTNPMFQSICWTMVHSLWQGIVLALLAAMVIVLTRKSSAALRYNLLGLCSILFIAGVSITFYMQVQNTRPVAAVVSQHTQNGQIISPGPAMANQSTQAAFDNAGKQQPTLMDSVAGFLNHNAALIVALWFLFFMIKFVQLLGGLKQIHDLRKTQVLPVDAYWHARLQKLKALLHIKHAVRLVETARIKTPAVTGFFKPVILLPVGLLANIPPAEAEAILLHELAHIRRNDYLVNLVQGFGEIVLYFNTGFMWVSALIKTERENCCDDMALAVTKQKAEFVNALVLSQEYDLRRTGLALGFGQRKTHLLNRARRILSNRNHSLNTTEKTLLSLCLAMSICMVYAFDYTSPRAKTEKGLAGNTAPKKDHAPVAKPVIAMPAFYTGMGGDTKQISGQKMSKLDSLQRADSLFKINHAASRHELQIKRDKATAEIEKFKASVKKGASDMEQMEIDMQRSELEMKRAEIDIELAEIEIKHSEITMAIADIHIAQAEIESKDFDKLIGELKQVLQKTTGEEITSFELNSTSLTVNGKKQSDALHLEMSKKHLKPKTSMFYFEQKGTKTMGISDEEN